MEKINYKPTISIIDSYQEQLDNLQDKINDLNKSNKLQLELNLFYQKRLYDLERINKYSLKRLFIKFIDKWRS